MADSGRYVPALLAALLLAGCGDDGDEPLVSVLPGTGPTASSSTPGPTLGPDRLRECVRTTREKARGLRLAGRTEAAAAARLNREGLGMRVTRRDGEALVVTMDLRCDRVNVAVEDGQVVRVVKVG
ncbi:MAG: hypothetical protein H0V81_17235 [Solirubrobacterales bacterium]|nr:hypothetical protein [Solirubrobacterales bacterium]